MCHGQRRIAMGHGYVWCMVGVRFAMPALAGVLERSSMWPAFWSLVAVGSFGTFAVGAWVIRRRLPDAVRSTPAAIRREREEFGTLAEP